MVVLLANQEHPTGDPSERRPSSSSHLNFLGEAVTRLGPLKEGYRLPPPIIDAPDNIRSRLPSCVVSQRWSWRGQKIRGPRSRRIRPTVQRTPARGNPPSLHRPTWGTFRRRRSAETRRARRNVHPGAEHPPRSHLVLSTSKRARYHSRVASSERGRRRGTFRVREHLTFVGICGATR